MNRHIFREYDVRGLVEQDLDAGTVEALGRAYGGMIADGGGRRVAVGMDVRETSPPLMRALVTGIRASGVDVVRLGCVPTPGVYFAVHELDLDGGVQITGSHNPVEYNGFKLMRGRASLHGAEIQALRERMESGGAATGAGAVEDVDVNGRYLDRLARDLAPARPLTLVVDAGNGCAGSLAPALFRRLGCRVHELFCEPDGRFPHHIPDPTLPETLGTLRDTVAATGADLGVAFDGDADRLGAVDERGRILWGDQLLALFARDLLSRRPGATVLFEVKCSRALGEDILAHGGRPVMTRTGHSLIKAAMKEHAAPLAGEMSGHLFFADEWYGFDDGIYAAGRLARLVAGSDRPLSALVDSLPSYAATPEIRLDCADEAKFAVVERVLGHYRSRRPVVDIDGARVDFDDGWGLVRASNTQPVLVVRAEGVDEAARDRIVAELREVLGRFGAVWPGSAA